MNAQKLIRNVLLVFALGSVAYLVVSELADHRRATHATGASAADITPGTKLVVYFFSEGKECTTCEQIPLYTRAALDEYFAGELKSGTIVYCAIDVDEARNLHYIDRYGIYTKSIVLSRIANGSEVRWKDLNRIWDLVYDKSAFVAYVRDQVRTELDAPA